MKANLFLGFIIMSFMVNANAGTITAGGPVQFIYDAVCHTNDLKYFISVGMTQNGSVTHQIIVRNQDVADDSVIVLQLDANQLFTQMKGQNLIYVGQDFSLHIRADEFQDGGAGNPGQVEMKIDNTVISSPVSCAVFSAAP